MAHTASLIGLWYQVPATRNLHYDIPNRIALGPYVIDEERVTGYSHGGPDMVRAALVYRFDGTVIQAILILS